MFIFVEVSFLCVAYGVTLLFPRHFSSTLILLAIATTNNLTISFDINNYSVLIFTMVTVPFRSTRDLTMQKQLSIGVPRKRSSKNM